MEKIKDMAIGALALMSLLVGSVCFGWVAHEALTLLILWFHHG